MTTHANGGMGKEAPTQTTPRKSPATGPTVAAAHSTNGNGAPHDHVRALDEACARAESTRASLREFANRLADAGYATQDRIVKLIDRLESQGDTEKRLNDLLSTAQSQVQKLSADVRESVEEQLRKVSASLREEQAAGERLKTLITESQTQCERSITQIKEEAEAQIKRIEATVSSIAVPAGTSTKSTPSETVSAGSSETTADWEQRACERMTQAMDVKIRMAMQAFEERIQAAMHRSITSLTEEAQRQTQVIREEREQALRALRSAEGDAHAHLAEPPQRVSALLQELEHSVSRGQEVSTQLETQITTLDGHRNAAASGVGAALQGIDISTLEAFLSKLESAIDEGQRICDRQQSLMETMSDHDAKLTASAQTAHSALEEQTRTITKSIDASREADQLIEHKLRNADQKMRELVSLIQSGRECSVRLAEQVKEAHGHSDQLLTALQSADSWSRHIDDTLRRTEQTMRGHETTADTQQRRIAEAISQLTQHEKQMESLVTSAGLQQHALESLMEQCRASHEHMTQETELLSEAMAKLDASIERTVEVSDEANARNQQLREAVQLADKRSQIQRQERQLDEASIKELRTQSEISREVLGELERARSEAAETIARLQNSSGEALSAVRGVHDLLNRVDTKRTELTELEQITTDTIERVHLVSETLQQLAQRTNDLRTTLDQSLTEPRQLVTAAQAQGDQLRNVCQAVKKVASGLSQTTLQANERIKSFNEASQTAERKLDQLQRDTLRAAETLKHWVEEAIRAQTRLAATLSETPTIDRTHPLDALRSLSEISSNGSTNTTWDSKPVATTTPSEASDTESKLSQSLQAARNRNKDISRLIEEARQRAESLVS